MIRIANATENCHYSPQLGKRVKCDVPRFGLGAAIEQMTVNGWKPIAIISRFMNSCKERHSVNDYELLCAVLSIVFFENYLYGKQIKVIIDHRALILILKENFLAATIAAFFTQWPPFSLCR